MPDVCQRNEQIQIEQTIEETGKQYKAFSTVPCAMSSLQSIACLTLAFVFSQSHHFYA